MLKRRANEDSVATPDIKSDSGNVLSRKKIGNADMYDSSDEEDLRNTIGNIPFSWYDDEIHFGYDWDGKKIEKPSKTSDIDSFLEKMEDPNYWRKVKDKQTGKDVVLNDDQISVLMNVRRGRYPTVGYNPYEPFLDFVSAETELHPLSNRPEDKRSFLPSVHEQRAVSRMVHAIKMGWARPPRPKLTQEQLNAGRFYDLWGSVNDNSSKTKSELARIKMHFPAPRIALPGHEASYNPPAEYLPTEKERQKWQETEPDERRQEFLSEKYGSMREIPAYRDFIKERYERCLDLFLAPRQRKHKLNVDPKDLLPDLPKPQDLQPFPTTMALVYKGHQSTVRSVCMEPRIGQLMASGSEDSTVRIWEVASGRSLRCFKLQSPVCSVAWCPNEKLSIVAVACSNSLLLLNVGCTDRLIVSETCSVLNRFSDNSINATDATQESAKWSIFDKLDGSEATTNHIRIELDAVLKQVVWHPKGDYCVTVSADRKGSSKSKLVVHQLSKFKSQAPFNKMKGSVQCVCFHPSRPVLFVALQRHIRMYDLSKQEMIKKLTSNCRWISTMAVHPKGDNLVCAGYDCRLCWFDLDLSAKPYKTFRHHKAAIRHVSFHKHYPLMASCSDDGSVMVYHGRVYNDLMQNPQIVPVKILHGHTVMDGLSVMSCVFHPKQPWLVTAGVDNKIILYTY